MRITHGCRCGCHMASTLTQAALAKAVSSAGKTESVLRACLIQLKTNIIICLAVPHTYTVTYISSTTVTYRAYLQPRVPDSHLFHQAS